MELIKMEDKRKKWIGLDWISTVWSMKRVHFDFFQYLAPISIIQYAMDKSNMTVILNVY